MPFQSIQLHLQKGWDMLRELAKSEIFNVLLGIIRTKKEFYDVAILRQSTTNPWGLLAKAVSRSQT